MVWGEMKHRREIFNIFVEIKDDFNGFLYSVKRFLVYIVVRTVENDEDFPYFLKIDSLGYCSKKAELKLCCLSILILFFFLLSFPSYYA